MKAPNRKIKKDYRSLPTPSQDIIRLGNDFVNDFLFEDDKAVDIPLDALRTIFNIASNLRNEQLVPKDQMRQLSLFEDTFETEHNTFASMKIKNKLISPSGTSRNIQNALEYLVKFKQGWYTSINKEGREIKTYGGLISSPTYDERGYSSFLISSYWLKKLVVIPEYNPTLFTLVYNITNNKHIIFAIWLAKVPTDTGTTLKLSTFNEKFGVNYSTAKDFCGKFLKPIQNSLNQFNTTSFNYSASGDRIHIHPYDVKSLGERKTELEDKIKKHDHTKHIKRRLRYYEKTHELDKQQIEHLAYFYESMPQNEALIEGAYKAFVRDVRRQKKVSADFVGINFLNRLQEFIILIYRETPTGKALPQGYPKIVEIV